MAKILTEYREQRDKMTSQPVTDFSVQRLRIHGELVYRIGVLEAMEFLLLQSPAKPEPQAYIIHYQLFDAMVAQLLGERRYKTPDPKQAKNCLAAYQNLQRIQQDYQRRFSGCPVATYTAEQYRADISKSIQMILVAWMAYRDTLLNVREEKNHE